MGSSSAREYLVILAGFLVGVALMISTIQQLRRGERSFTMSGRLYPVEMLAWLVLGAGLVLLALFLLAGLTVWAGAAASTAPAWAAPVGLALLAIVLLAGLVVVAFAAARRLRAKPAQPR